MNNYDDKMNYELFLCEQIYMQNDLTTFAKECSLIAEGTNTIENIKVLNEESQSIIKNIIDKIINTITKIFNKFTVEVNNRIKNGKPYLDRYKDIILRKKPLDSTYTMFNYPKGIPVMIKDNVPDFNYNVMKQYLDTKEHFIQQYFRDVAAAGKPPYDNFSDLSKSVFRGGGEVQMDSRKLNMTDMFNFCYDYEDINKYIEKDLETVKKVANEADRIVKQAASNPTQPNPNQQAQSQQQNQSQKPAGNTQPNTQPKPAGNAQPNPNGNNQPKPQNDSFDMFRSINNKKMYYSAVYEAYIEEGDGAPVRNMNNTKGTDGMPTQVKPGAAYRQVSPEQNKQNQAALQKAGVNAGGDEAAIKAINAEIQVYLKTCTEYITAKMTCAENAYNTYMSILKAHVKDYTNQEQGNKTEDRPMQQGTNYQQGNNQPQNNQGNNQQQ